MESQSGSTGQAPRREARLAYAQAAVRHGWSRRDALSTCKTSFVSRSRLEVIDGKARYNGRFLSGWVDDVVAWIFEWSDATQVVVFGSVERGEDGPDSDIDLLIVLPHVVNRHEAAAQVLRQLRDVPVPIDIIVVDEASLAERALEPGIVRVAIREGRVLHRAA